MAKPPFEFPSQVPQPIDSSFLRTIVQTPSLDNLRSHAASPCSLKGVYVRSRATSFANNSEENLNMNMIFHPEDGHTEYRLGPRHVTFDSHLATSFASFAQKESLLDPKPNSSPAGPSSSRANGYSTWELPESVGPPPGYSLRIDAGDDVIVYMAEERLEARGAARPLPLPASTRTKNNQATPCMPASIDTSTANQPPRPPSVSARISGSYATASSINHKVVHTSSARNSCDMSARHHTVTFATGEEREHTLKRMPRVHNLNNLRTQPQVGHDSPTIEQQPLDSAAVPSFFDNDDHTKSIQPAKTKALSRVIKVIKNKFNGQSSHRKADSSDTISVKSVAVFSTPVEKVKSSSASMFDIGAPGRAPSIRSTNTTMTSKSKKKVLVKQQRNSGKSRITDTHETALLTLSTRAIENKMMRRRSASFSGYTNVVQPEANQWTLPNDLDNELIQEALEVLSKQNAGDWVYKKRNRDSPTSATKYIVERRGQ